MLLCFTWIAQTKGGTPDAGASVGSSQGRHALGLVGAGGECRLGSTFLKGGDNAGFEALAEGLG